MWKVEGKHSLFPTLTMPPPSPGLHLYSDKHGETGMTTQHFADFHLFLLVLFPFLPSCLIRPYVSDNSPTIPLSITTQAHPIAPSFPSCPGLAALRTCSVLVLRQPPRIRHSRTRPATPPLTLPRPLLSPSSGPSPLQGCCQYSRRSLSLSGGFSRIDFLKLFFNVIIFV